MSYQCCNTDPDRHQNLIICSLANLPCKFHSNLFRSFCTKLLTSRQKTDKQRELHILFDEGNKTGSTRVAIVTHAGDVGNADEWAFLLTVHANCFLFGSILRLEQVIIARRPLIISLTVPDDGGKTFTDQRFRNISATEFTV